MIDFFSDFIKIYLSSCSFVKSTLLVYLTILLYIL